MKKFRIEATRFPKKGLVVMLLVSGANLLLAFWAIQIPRELFLTLARGMEKFGIQEELFLIITCKNGGYSEFFWMTELLTVVATAAVLTEKWETTSDQRILDEED